MSKLDTLLELEKQRVLTVEENRDTYKINIQIDSLKSELEKELSHNGCRQEANDLRSIVDMKDEELSKSKEDGEKWQKYSKQIETIIHLYSDAKTVEDFFIKHQMPKFIINITKDGESKIEKIQSVKDLESQITTLTNENDKYEEMIEKKNQQKTELKNQNIKLTNERDELLEELKTENPCGYGLMNLKNQVEQLTNEKKQLEEELKTLKFHDTLNKQVLEKYKKAINELDELDIVLLGFDSFFREFKEIIKKYRTNTK